MKPSVTFPCHFSMAHSVTPERHGILTNTYVPQVRPVTGIFEKINAAGGVSGISTILYQTLNIAPGLTFAFINIILLILGVKILGKKFTVKTLFGAGLLSLFVQLFSYLPASTDNVFLASFFGGTLYGIGIGIAFAAGASTGGTDILSRIIQHFLPQFPIGKLLLVVDGLVITASLIVFKDTELVLFGIFALFSLLFVWTGL